MSLLDYIKGRRKGTSAHRLEKESMHDPFLQEAIDGFDSVDDDHLTRIASIRSSIVNAEVTTKAPNRTLWKVIAAASILIFFIAGTQLLMNTKDIGLQAQSMAQLPIEIYVPDDFYKENIAIIAHRNTELTRDVSVVTDKHKNKDSSEREIISRKTKSIEPIDVYVPSK